MPGDIDVYQMCPCGSGRKLKFCCHAIVTEMVKVADLQYNNQPQTALTLLDTVEKKIGPRDVWPRAWFKTTKAFLHFSLGVIAQSRRLVAEVLEELPEHPLAVAVNGLLALTADGYPGAKRPLYRAFQISVTMQSHFISHLMMQLAQVLMTQGHIMAARQYLGLAMRIDSENEEVVKTLVDFISDGRLPYVLRDGYTVSPLIGNDHLRPQFDQAVNLTHQGCFSDAAKAFGSLARHDPKQPGLWWNIALCHAWAGEDPLAVEAFKAAAANQPDFEAAVDCLVLAHELRILEPANKVPQLAATYRVDSVSRLLTVLDQKPEYARTALPSQEADDEPRPAAMYRIVDRDPKLIPNSSLTLGNVAHILGEVIVFDRSGNGTADDVPAKAYITGYGRERVDRLMAAFADAVGTLATVELAPEEHGFLRVEHFPLVQDWHLPGDLSAAQSYDLRMACSRHLVEDIWPTVAQESLGGKTPLEAAAVPELKTALAAAIADFEIFCEKNSLPLDEGAMRKRLGLPAISATPPAQKGEFDFPTLLQLRHTIMAQVPDEQLPIMAETVMQIGHSARTCAVVGELLSRPSLQDKTDVPRWCMLLSRVYMQRFDFDTALRLIVRGKQEVKNRKQPLDALALWEIHELLLRSQRPDDPQTSQLASLLWNFYVPKLPEIRNVVLGVLNKTSLPGPWNAGAVSEAAGEPLAVAGVGSSALWTPESQPSEQPSKLWLPGQE